MEQIHLINTSPQELVNLFTERVEIQLQEFNKNLKVRAESEFLTIQEVSNLLRCNRSTVHNFCVKKILIKNQIGGKILFRREDVEQAIVKLK